MIAGMIRSEKDVLRESYYFVDWNLIYPLQCVMLVTACILYLISYRAKEQGDVKCGK